MGRTHKKTVKQKRIATETIEIDDITLALRDLVDVKEEDFADCLSVEQVAEKLGEDKNKARAIIKEGIANGSCEYAGKRRGTGIDGRITKIPVYRFKFKNKGGNKR